MASFLWDFFLFLLPSLVLLLLSLALRRPRVLHWTKLAVRAAGWNLWVITCKILDLPLCDKSSAWSSEARSTGLDSSGGPKLICKPTALARYLLRNCSFLTRSRLAEWPPGDPHLQTFSSQLWGTAGDSLQFTRDLLLLRDGGLVALDWAVGTRVGEAVERRRWEGRKTLGCFTSAPPVLLLIPQYWGGMTPHLKRLCHQALRQGFHAVVFHPRGTAGCPLTSARLTEFGDPADLEQAVSYVRSRYPSSVLVAVSEGSGSGLLLSYLGEFGSGSHLTAAAALSPVLQGQLWFHTDLPPLYRWGALLQRKLQLSRYASSFRGILDVDRALRSSSLRHFEETLFCSSSRPPVTSMTPSASWALGERAQPAEDWEDYWERNEPLREADEVAVPLLCICSRDDPLLPPASTLPLHLFRTNPFFLLLLTERGGHCGFTLEEEKKEEEEEEEEGGGNWSHVAVLEYFKVVAEFLRGEDREGTAGDAPQRNRMSSVTSPRKRRPVMMMRRLRAQAAGSCVEEEGEEEEKFTWRRSYTR